MKIVKNFQLKIVIISAVKTCCILHGCVFVLCITEQQYAEAKGPHYVNTPM